jgi:hypothetical protein
VGQAFELEKLAFMHRLGEQEKLGSEEKVLLQRQLEQMRAASEERIQTLMRDNRILEVCCCYCCLDAFSCYIVYVLLRSAAK